MKLINSPQFDTCQFDLGEAVKIKRDSSLTPIKDMRKDRLEELGNEFYALILAVRPLQISILTYNRKEVVIDINDVTSKYIDIIQLTEVKEND